MAEPMEFVVVLLAGSIAIAILVPVLLRWRRQSEFRLCPRCGQDVVRGAFVCEACGFDFRTEDVMLTAKREDREEAR